MNPVSCMCAPLKQNHEESAYQRWLTLSAAKPRSYEKLLSNQKGHKRGSGGTSPSLHVEDRPFAGVESANHVSSTGGRKSDRQRLNGNLRFSRKLTNRMAGREVVRERTECF